MRYTTDSYRRAIHRACDKAFPHPELSKLKARELTVQQKKSCASGNRSTAGAPTSYGIRQPPKSAASSAWKRPR